MVVYLFFVIAIGVVTKRKVQTSDYFPFRDVPSPPGSVPTAFLSASIGATELLGMAANGSQYGLATVHYYWIGAVPAMVFLGLIMMLSTTVRGCVRCRNTFDCASTALRTCTSPIIFSVATIRGRGQSLCAGPAYQRSHWPSALGIVVVSAGVVLLYTTTVGLTATMYNEVLQFFIIELSWCPCGGRTSPRGWHRT